MPSPTQSRYEAPQLEFSFVPQVSVDVRVQRLADGRVLLTPTTEVRVWGSTRDAAEALGKSPFWVRERLECGEIRGERLGRNWRVDMVHVQELRKAGRNF
jgi:hypothetical protein